MSLGFYKKKKSDIALILLVLLLMIYTLMGSDAHPYLFTEEYISETQQVRGINYV